MYEKYHTKGFELLSVNVSWDKDAPARKLVEESRLPFPVGRDSSGTIAGAYRVDATPASFFIDRKGVLVERVKGAFEGDQEGEFSRRIEKLLDRGEILAARINGTAEPPTAPIGVAEHNDEIVQPQNRPLGIGTDNSAVGAVSQSSAGPASTMSRESAFIIAVPTPFKEEKKADMQYVISASESIVPHLRAGNLVVLESTSPPRTTVDIVQPILERSGLKAGVDFCLVYSPERVLPVQILRELIENTRDIGGVDRSSAEAGRDLPGRSDGRLEDVDAVVGVAPVEPAAGDSEQRAGALHDGAEDAGQGGRRLGAFLDALERALQRPVGLPIVDHRSRRSRCDYYDIVTARLYGELLAWYRYRVKSEYCLLGQVDGYLVGIVNGRMETDKVGMSYHTLAIDRGLRIGSHLFAAKMEYHLEYLGQEEVLIVAESPIGFRRWMIEYPLEPTKIPHELGGGDSWRLTRDIYFKAKSRLVVGDGPVPPELLEEAEAQILVADEDVIRERIAGLKGR